MAPVHSTVVLREARAARLALSTSSWFPSASPKRRKLRDPPRTGSTRSAVVEPETLSWRPRCWSSCAAREPSAAGEHRSKRGMDARHRSVRVCHGFGEFSSLLTVKTLTGMTTDVYPRENCIAPAIVFIVWTVLNFVS